MSGVVKTTTYCEVVVRWQNEKQSLYAGATLEEAGKWLTVAGALWGELTIAGVPEY